MKDASEMAERDRGLIGWALIAMTLAVCCGLPIIALLVVVAGGTAAVLTGTLWMALGAIGIASVIVAVHVARRRAATRGTPIVRVAEGVQRSGQSEEFHGGER